ncbi:SDR family NAD(P)-dependent oxidoreductase [Azohydromonas caseinilytica]|uniref:SDR family oxidoreductase n=1 Tax=Azohydromonas caseinilytica TaxID=2728836 RepID=A0A848FJI9_9BURK|nr:SDR family oxidoreductase [Azohydromonas caseinilytica]NML17981.1 SDR family oxidoreductase [Azohydromonas caseinilytica]
MSTTPAPSSWLQLENRVCAVTGAGSGIGAAIAAELVAAGARVALLDRNGAAAEQVAARLAAVGGTVLALECDVSREGSVREAAQRVQRELGDCGVLVNNAGLLKAGALESVSVEEWNAVLAINLTGQLLCARAFQPQLLAAGQGSIVNVASIAALHPQTRSGAYSASKAGVLLMSRQLAAEWGPQGLRSNAICPGMIRTPLSAAFYEEPGFEARRAALTASRRIGEPIDIANAALFLASPRSGYLNGAELVVDGGMDTMLMDLVPRPGFNAVTA